MKRDQVIDGRYRIIEQIGNGGMGAVYKAQHLTLTHRMAALKVVHPHLASDPSFLERFEREAQSASRVEHPNAVTVYDFGRTDDGRPYIALEYVEGETLSNRISAAPDGLDVAEVVDVTRQVASALASVHAQGIVHRDLKPDNIMIRPDGQAKVLDFGIAKAAEGTQVTGTGQALGTPAYMSPEQWRAEELDGRADQYALGVIVYEMLAGKAPFVSNTPAGYVHQHLYTEAPTFGTKGKKSTVTPAVQRAVLKALSKDKAKRYESVEDFAAALEAAAAPKRTDKAPAVGRSSKPRAWGRLALSISFGVIVGAVGLLAWMVWLAYVDEQEAFNNRDGLIASFETSDYDVLRSTTDGLWDDTLMAAPVLDDTFIVTPVQEPRAIEAAPEVISNPERSAPAPRPTPPQLFNEALVAYENQNYAAALAPMREAAERGNADAQYHLGEMYFSGDGVARDEEAAARWYRRAAEQDHTKAQFFMGTLHRYGWGVQQDCWEAQRWWQRAADLGDPDGRERVADPYFRCS